MGFGHCEVDPCVYAREVRLFIVAVHVDDLLICCESDRAVEIVKTELTHHLTITDTRELKEIVGWNLNKISNGITIDQSSFMSRLTQQYESYITKTKTPILCDTLLHGRLVNEQPADLTMYRSLMGSLQYLATGVWVDVVFIINVLARYVADPTIRHMKIARKVLSYIAQTPNMGLGYRVEQETSSDVVF
jgi:Reverse transcriptase (RNA-dependent DNA polymerase)